MISPVAICWHMSIQLTNKPTKNTRIPIISIVRPNADHWRTRGVGAGVALGANVALAVKGDEAVNVADGGDDLAGLLVGSGVGTGVKVLVGAKHDEAVKTLVCENACETVNCPEFVIILSVNCSVFVNSLVCENACVCVKCLEGGVTHQDGLDEKLFDAGKSSD